MSDVGHTLILGPTGSGKSTLVGLLMAQFFRYPGAQVFLFDKDYSSYVLAHACGAEYYDILGDTDHPLSFYPLATLDTLADRVWAQEWVEVLLGLQGLQISPSQRKALYRALELLGAGPSRTLTDLANTLQDHDLREGLNHYTLAGGLGGLLDAKNDSVGAGLFQVLVSRPEQECEGLDEPSAIPVATDGVRRQRPGGGKTVRRGRGEVGLGDYLA